MLAETGSRYLSDLAEIVTITGRFSMIVFVGRWRRGRTRRRVAWQPDSFFFFQGCNWAGMIPPRKRWAREIPAMTARSK